ncbi:uncharacterized protein TNCV_4465421 [Trichonephila clavipes]|nr:uncharacterized protein TNCV_4465421 [Trichonephila clavipes]
MDVCKCIVPLRHGGTLNSRRVASAHVRLVKGEEKLEVLGPLQGFLPLNWGGTEKSRTVTCMVLKAKANDKCKILAFSHDELRKHRSDFVRQILVFGKLSLYKNGSCIYDLPLLQHRLTDNYENWLAYVCFCGYFYNILFVAAPHQVEL